MKIATYNINGINGRLEILLRWLKEAQPDIVCLQELKSEDHKFPEKAINEAGYRAIWHGQKSWNGVAILSKTEIRELRNDLPGEDDEFTHSRYIEGFINGIVIGCIYLPNGNPWPGPKFDYKLRWFKRLAEHAQALVNRDLPVILIGDYNVMPTELDTYKPEKYLENALFRPESRQAYRDLINQGWTDAIRALYPNERIYTFWDHLRDAFGRNAGLRLDHFLLNKKIAGRLSIAQVDKHVRAWQGSSDHAPVWIELALEHIATVSGKGKRKAPNKSSPDLIVVNEEFPEPQGLETLLSSLPKIALPLSIKPMKATLVDEPFDKAGWIYEIKWDGYRALSFVDQGNATIMSRNNLVFDQFQPINDALQKWPFNAVVDGEIVALNNKGTADFGVLQNWRNSKNAHLAYFIFDILWYNGKDLTGLSLKSRKEILDAILPITNELIRASQTFEVGGIEFFEAAKKMKLEGIIAKRAESLYSADTRSRDWLKIKVKRRQEVIIAGFTKNEGTGKHFSALAIGVYDQKRVLRYIGKVGTGFNDTQQKDLMALFKPLISNESPFDVEPDVDEPSQFRPRRMGAIATWLKPELVCEVEFAEVTSDGKVRQASFKGMRSDKNPKDVIMEIEAVTELVINELDHQSVSQKSLDQKPELKKADKPNSVKAPANLLFSSKKETEELKVDGHLLKFTHLNKLYWPEDGVTKRDMFNYYHQVAPFMVPYLRDRPMSLNRFPGGIHGESFYQKNVRDKAPDWAMTMPHRNGEGINKDYLLGNNEATLLWMASLGCIEMNPWFSRIQSPDNPDYCIIDLDPDKQHFDQVVQVALEVKKVLDAIGVPSYPKTSGSTGMHIYIPLGARYTYDQSQLFANIIVKIVQKELPDFTTLERMISNREGKMYLDFLQNRPGATIAGVYSLRPKPGATVSMPVSWEEVKPGLSMRDFTIHNAIDRLKETGDLFHGVLGEGIDLLKTIQKAQAIF